MSYVLEMLREAWRLLHHDPDLGGLTVRTLRLALEATLIALLAGLPVAAALGLGRSRAARAGRLVANALVGLPPVAIGVLAVLLLQGRSAPWGGYWLGSLNGMVLAQSLLSLPVVVAVGAAAVAALPGSLTEQARAFGASRGRVALLALREARRGLLGAALVALGAAFGEVGAVTLIGGNDAGSSATLASQMLNDARVVDVPAATEHALALMAFVVGLGLLAVLVERRGARAAP